MSDSTKLSRVDNAHVALEVALSDILGVPDNTVITNPIFGVSHDGEDPVQPDGSIRGVMKFYESGVESSASAASGFEFTDGTKTKRLVMVSSGLKIYSLSGTTWSPVTDLENTVQGSGYFANLSDVDPSLTPTAGQLVSWDAVNGWWESVDPASGSGKTRFADLDDTPAAANPAPGDPFAAADVNKIVYIASTSALGFKAEPAGLGPPWVMMLTATATDSWRSSANFGDAWNWAPMTFSDDGGFLIDDTSLITSDGADGNKFIALDAGLYQISLYYSVANPNKFGTRSWRIQGTNSDGPATFGIQQQANLFWNPALPDTENPGTLGGLHWLGTQTLIQFSDGTIHFEINQDSKTTFTGLVLYAVIARIK